MKRYYLSKIEQEERAPGFFTYAHRLQRAYPDVDKRFTGEIAVDPQTGVPLHAAVLCVVGAIDHTELAADPRLVAFPQVPANMKVSATHTPTKNAFKEACIALGFSPGEIDQVVGNADGWSDVLDHFGQKNDPGFSWQNFDLDES